VIDFNRSVTREQIVSDAINTAIDDRLTESISEQTPRDYLGASAIGHECLRKIAWDWRSPVQHEPRTDRIFARGKWLENYAYILLMGAGFRMVRSGSALGFSQLNERFQGHADGVVVAGPAMVSYPCVWESKGLGSKGWNKLYKDGLVKTYPGYADQVALYQVYLGLTDHPALFTAANLDTMEMLHLLIPFDAERAQRASDRAVQVIMADEAGETLPRVTDNPADWRCKWCGHRERCWG
jgi:hypothetical protein